MKAKQKNQIIVILFLINTPTLCIICYPFLCFQVQQKEGLRQGTHLQLLCCPLVLPRNHLESESDSYSKLVSTHHVPHNTAFAGSLIPLTSLLVHENHLPSTSCEPDSIVRAYVDLTCHLISTQPYRKGISILQMRTQSRKSQVTCPKFSANNWQGQVSTLF